jgi:hypothetical protein
VPDAVLGDVAEESLDHVEPGSRGGREVEMEAIVLFQPKPDLIGQYDGWRELALGGVGVVCAPGNHETMFLDSNVRRFGRLVEAIMDREGGRNRGAATKNAPLLDVVPVFSVSPPDAS